MGAILQRCSEDKKGGSIAPGWAMLVKQPALQLLRMLALEVFDDLAAVHARAANGAAHKTRWEAAEIQRCGRQKIERLDGGRRNRLGTHDP